MRHLNWIRIEPAETAQGFVLVVEGTPEHAFYAAEAARLTGAAPATPADAPQEAPTEAAEAETTAAAETPAATAPSAPVAPAQTGRRRRNS